MYRAQEVSWKPCGGQLKPSVRGFSSAAAAPLPLPLPLLLLASMAGKVRREEKEGPHARA
jgi:hypothetical protein